jgi:metal-responsive CopG/Arc/MetJ family transcriptional regulator
MPDGNKQKFALWIHPDTQQMVERLYKGDNCKSRSEFIEKAVRFYCGYLSAQDAVDILPRALTSAVSGAVQSSENRMARLLFKLAVEMSMMMNVVAAGADVDEIHLNRLRGRCVEDVKKSIGAVNFDEVLKFQRGG